MPDGKPNILVIWGDDIGITNLSCYSDGLMGYRTPNIDRIANEGMRFTDSYGEQSCTAGRAAFISGQSVYRTGMSKVGVPGAPIGWAAEDPTIAELLKPLGYATGQFGKNHFGDLNKYLPTVHGFDEFFGNLYHLNAEEEPEEFDYPHKDQFPKLYELAHPRGVSEVQGVRQGVQGARRSEVRSGGQAGHRGHRPAEPKADGNHRRRDHRGVHRLHQAPGQGGHPVLRVDEHDPHARVGLTRNRRAAGRPGYGSREYHDTMIDHDRNVGQLLDALDELGIAEDTIVVYSTDNGPHRNSWPDAGTTPFRSEKNSNWEGAFRVPEMVRWPGKIPAGVVSNEIVQHHDWLPTFLAAAGEPDIGEKLEKGHKVGEGRQFKVHLDAYNLLPYLTGEVETSPRRGFIYFSDDCDVLGIRFENWKVVFMEQRCKGTMQIWAEPFTALRVPKLFNLRTDPFEYADITSNTYYDWLMHHDFFIFYATAIATQFLESFKEFPPRHPPASFSIDQAVEKLHEFLAKD